MTAAAAAVSAPSGRGALLLLGSGLAAASVLVLLPRAPAALVALGIAAALAPLWRAGWREPDVLVALLCSFVYLNLSEVLVRRLEAPALLPLLALAVLAVAAARGRVTPERAGAARVLLAMAPFALLTVASSAWARDRVLADAAAVETLKGFALVGVLALAISGVGGVRRATAAVAAAAALLALLAIGQTVTGAYDDDFGGLARVKHAQIYDRVFEPRVAGPLGDPNFFAQALVMVVPVTLALAFDEPRRRRRVLALAAACLAAAATVLTYSRGAAVALGIVTALSAASRRVNLRQAALAAGFGLLVLALAPEGFTRRLVTIEQVVPGNTDSSGAPDSSFEERRLLTGVAWRIFQAHPLLGVGAGNYAAHFDEHAPEVGSVQRESEDRPHFAHSLYLEIAAETGAPGLAAFGLLVGVAFAELRRAERALRAAGRGREAGLARGFEIALLGYLCTSLFLHGHFIRYLWILLGLSAAIGRAARELSPAEAA